MLPSASRERVILGTSMATLALTALAAAVATLIPWLNPVRHTMDLIIPPLMCGVFLSLLIGLARWPRHVLGIMRTALLAALLALAAPAWFYSWQAISTPGLRLVDIYPPVAPLLLALMVMAMIYLPSRQALLVVLGSWLLVALPVLVYLLDHPQEMQTPRGNDLLMSYGPVFMLVVVVLPIQRALAGKIKHLVSEQARMEVMVNRDPLTRLYNRRFNEHVLQDLLARQAPAGVIMFDMDRFKAINDTHGHPVGDQVLQRVAQRCQQLLRQDECLARWGGEEFLLVVPGADAATLQALGERLRATIAGLSIPPVPQVGASVGLGLIQPDDTLAQLLQRVDQAMYRAKQQGGNVVVW
ncbi:MAG: GGDEF domain-containing protein [Pseudoxanthomonas sp.]